MTTTTVSPVRTGQASSNGDGDKISPASTGPRGERARRRAFSSDYKLAILAE